jgi:hypothetical protein
MNRFEQRMLALYIMTKLWMASENRSSKMLVDRRQKIWCLLSGVISWSILLCCRDSVTLGGNPNLRHNLRTKNDKSSEYSSLIFFPMNNKQ